MSRSRSRSTSVDFGQKSDRHSSIFSKSIFASKLCRGDAIAAQIDTRALKSVSNLSEKHGVRGNISLQQQPMREMEGSESGELVMEVESLKKMVASARDESKAKDRKMANLEAELGRMRQGEADKDASLGQLMKELRELREKETKIHDLERELERKTMAESSMARQLDSAMFELEESKIEIASLHEKIDGLEDLCNRISKEVKENEEVRSLKSKVLKAQEGEMRAVSKAESLAEEMEVLKGEWKFAMEGEDKSSKAMDDLAMALKEVAMESNKAKMELSAKEAEVERMKKELVEAKQEVEVYRTTADRLRAETEETLFAWNAKEIGFMSCIKRAEEERALAQIESHKSAESLKAAENMTRSAREETYKLRDILKQAINESNAAKAASGIARDENSLLKDCLAEKEEAVHFITRENERLRISEAASQEHVKQLKRMLTMTSAEIKIDDKDEIGLVMFTDRRHDEDEDEGEDRKFSFDLDDLKFMNEDEDEDEDPEKDEALKGSIFDTSVETPKAEARTPKATLFRLKSAKSTSTSSPPGDEHMSGGEDGHDEGEGDKQHGHRRSKTMFQRVGGLLTIRKSFHRKEPSIEQKTTPSQTQQPSHD
ncbi:WEB family protein, chloroplastic-like [Salvia divinorum]|uniref:WEB family protein, chloroplastic-like n=1 Tax=Salvia divinorum TaxID=28513 RepID=A0ABD1IKJ0_SALDI